MLYTLYTLPHWEHITYIFGCCTRSTRFHFGRHTHISVLGVAHTSCRIFRIHSLNHHHVRSFTLYGGHALSSSYMLELPTPAPALNVISGPFLPNCASVLGRALSLSNPRRLFVKLGVIVIRSRPSCSSASSHSSALFVKLRKTSSLLCRPIFTCFVVVVLSSAGAFYALPCLHRVSGEQVYSRSVLVAIFILPGESSTPAFLFLQSHIYFHSSRGVVDSHISGLAITRLFGC